MIAASAMADLSTSISPSPSTPAELLGILEVAAAPESATSGWEAQSFTLSSNLSSNAEESHSLPASFSFSP